MVSGYPATRFEQGVVKSMFTPLLVAIQFLTRLPVPLRQAPRDDQVGASMLYYPLVGLMIGLLMLLLAYLSQDSDPLLQAVLVLFLWVVVSGGLHIDGLADTADAWVGGQGDAVRTLLLMKDPTCGPIAVSAVVLLLLLKLAALHSLLLHGDWTLLLLVPVIGRGVLVAAFLFIPYIRPGGLGFILAASLPSGKAKTVLLICALLSLSVWGLPAAWMLALATLLLLLWRRALVRRIGGLTGDAAGALCEVTEAAVLLLTVLIP